MRKLLLVVGILFAALTGGAANAAPFGMVTAPAASPVVNVDYACGRGFHLSPRGYCRPNRWAPPPRPRYYSHHWHRRDHWDRRGPPRRDWRDRREYRRW